MADVTIWAAYLRDGEYGEHAAVAHRQSEESARAIAEREYRASDEATETDYRDSWDERQVKAQLGVPSVPEPRFDPSKLRWVPRLRTMPDAGSALQVWKNFGPYGPGWHATAWMVEKIEVKP
jgi:hypothetical protein